ncbi:MAG: low molecular weight phosphatase family protein [Burkholderiales bacterium 66-5]|nr:MAG: ArsC family transcriptional regulator [Bordetella sp. SCN 67-23]OJU91674.1 MAG: low molecular weight phosphatase family protein [Burkholderiales bacterium 66-5]
MTTNVLILCTHNSARSVLSEGMLNHWAKELGTDVRAYSAGSAPSGRINPMAIDVLQSAGIDASGYRSKSWDEFTGDAASAMRVVITVCDSAAQETCPYWPGSPVKIHWGYPDPSNVGTTDAEKRAAFESTRLAIGERMQKLAAVPFDALNDVQLRAALEAI